MRTPPALPPAAAERLADLESERDQALDAAQSCAQRLNSNPDRDGKWVLRMQGYRAKMSARHGELAGLVTGITQWLKTLRGDVVLEMAPPVSVQRNGSVSWQQTINTLRGEIDRLQRDLLEARNAPPPKSEIKKLARKWVEDTANKARPRIWIDNRGLQVDFLNPQTADAGMAFRDAVNTMMWLSPVTFITALESEIDMLPEPSLALTADEKAQRIDELTQRLDQLERQEEAMIDLAGADGVEVVRRPDAAPSAVLGVVVVTKAKAAQAA
jgi:hypothetical protein